MQKASPLPGIQHRTQATPVSSCELVPVAPPSFHQWRCQAGQYATPFIDAARNQGEAADQWLEKNLQLSDVKLQRPGEIMNNFKTGQLLSRKVDVDGEIKYQQGRLIPRPGTLIKEGVRVELFGNGLHLGLHPFNELYCFKKDIWSHENLGFLEGHKAHLLHPDRPRLLEKMSEKDNRYDSLYLPRSSGRLMDSGKHKSGHDKPDSINSAQETNETIIEGYRKEQYQCVLIEVPCRLDSLYEELQAKFRLEGELSIPELPLVFYEPNSGSIREIVYLSDLGINQELLKGMPGNLEKLNSFAERSVSPQLGRVLFMLPPSRLLEFLIYPNVDLARAVKELSTSYRNRLPDFVQKGDLASVQWCHERGADLTSTYCSQGEYCNLLELLLEARCVERHASYTHKKAPQKLKEQTRLGMLLYDQGCRVPVNFNLLQRLPSLAIYMLGKGEPYIKGALDNPLGTLAEQLYEGVISRDEFNQAITWLQQTYADQPGQLSLFFTNHLASQLKIQETMRFKPVDLGTECGSSVKEKILLEADALLAQGIPVNTGILQQYLTTYYEQEIKSLHCHADLDKKVFEKIVQETLEAQKHQNHKSYQENPQCQKCQKYKKYQDSQATLKEYLSKLDNDVIDQLNSGGARHNYFWNERLYFASRHPTSTEQPEREREERDASRKKQIDKLADQLVNSRDTYYYSSDDKLRSLVHDARDNRCPPKYSPATEINSRTELLKKEYRKIPTLISSEKIDTARSEAEELISKQVEQKSNQVKALCKALEDLLNTLEGMAESKPAQKHLPDTEKPTPEKYDAPAPQPKADSGPAFTWLRDLFRYTPDTYNKSYCELTRLAIRHYYQTPHPDQLEWLSQQKTEIGSLRADHGVDHVIRTQILAEALLELFYQHDPDYEELLNTMPELRELIPLALVYHDVVAEVEPKSVEEARAAEFFERDIKASGRYSEELITLVSSALRNKNTNTMRRVTDPFVSDTGCSDRERQVRRLLRLPDSIDIIRGLNVPENWKTPCHTASIHKVFDAGLMDLPETMANKQEFKKSFDSLMEGAKALAYVTGGKPKSDLSTSGNYLNSQNLRDITQKRKLKVARADSAYDSVIAALDDNVRRAIARKAGFTTCQADHSKKTVNKSLQASCLIIDEDRQALNAIHSESELRQVRLPGMSVLDKLRFEQEFTDCLEPEAKAQVESEVKRLREQGIQPALGTLTQETLKSRAAQKKLRNDYDLDVVEAKRFCGYGQDGRKQYTTIMVPSGIAPGKRQSGQHSAN